MKLYLVRSHSSAEFCGSDSQAPGALFQMNARKMAEYLRDGGQFVPEEIWYGETERDRVLAEMLRDVAAPEARLVSPDARNHIVGGDSIAPCFAELERSPVSVAVVCEEGFVRNLFCRVMDCKSCNFWDQVGGGAICINGQDYYCGMNAVRRRWSIFWMLSPGCLEEEKTS